MKNHFVLSVLILIVFITFCTSNQPQTNNKIILKNNWLLQSSAKLLQDGKTISSDDLNPDEWIPIQVPTTVLAALVNAGVYPNPYYGLNLKSIPGYKEGRWLAMDKDSPFYPSWWYRTEFKVPSHFNGKNLFLHFDGINYKANIWLNGSLVADTSTVIGMFRRFEFDISQYIKNDKKNILAVEIFAPGKIPDIKYSTKQLEATTGWDDHNPQPPDLNMGIWRNVSISYTGPVKISHPYVVTDLDLPSLDQAHLTISAELTNVTDQEISGMFSGSIEKIQFAQNITLAPGETQTITFTPEKFEQLNIKNPRIWWPHPVGPQELYNAELAFHVDNQISDNHKVQFGIREVSTYINDDGWRGYKVNGKNILIRGGAWMTSDMLLRLTPRRYEALVRYAREANLNMLRSEGFSIRETDEFYNMCDKYGIMVTQQIFGRNIPDEDLAVDIVKDMILRVRNHPSLVHFLGHDETFPTEHLDASYRELIKKYTPQRSYQPHSGAFELENRFKTGGTRTGTLELWTYATPSHYYTHKNDGAWGFAQSGGIGGIVMPYSSINKMMPKSAQWPINNETFSFHTVLQGIEYFDLVIKSLNERYGTPNGIQEFCTKAQALNYESARGMYEAYGRNKYDALGITTWKYDMAWPAAISWQYVDWYLNVGGAYYGAKKACNPLHVQYAYDDQSIYVINNYYESFDDLTVSAQLYNFDMTEKFSKSVQININPDDKIKALSIDWPQDLSTTHFLDMTLTDSQGNEISDNFYWLSTVPDIQGEKGYKRTDQGWGILDAKPKSFADFTALNDLPNVKLESEIELNSAEKENKAIVHIKNPEKNLAFMVHLSIIRADDGTEVTPVYWDDNYFSLLPGEEKTITSRYSINDLKGQKAQVKIDGWNIITE